MTNAPTVRAAVIFSDTFSGGYNNTLWTIYPGQFAPINTSFGIAVDPLHSNEYSTLVHNGTLPNNLVIKVDMKIKSSPASDMGIFINNAQTGTWKNVYMFGVGVGGTPNRTLLRDSNNWDNATSAWDTSIGTHHIEIIISSTASSPLILKEDGNTLATWTSHANFTVNLMLLSLYGTGTEFANYQVCDSSGCISPTPTPTPLPPVVIIPGMMASWNKEAILEGQASPATPWKILPFVTEYTGIMETLKHLGYTENQNLFLWPYDWRKSVATIQTNLDTFITGTVKPANPGRTINLIGHSLGGLVARAWTQTGINQSDVSHLITAGTPNAGAAKAYPAWSAGDLPQENSLLWLGERLILELNRRSFASNRETIRSTLPVVQNLLPVDAFLRRQIDSQLIDPTTMSFQNAWLSDLNTAATPIFPVFDAITGTTFSTINRYVVTAPTWLDTALGNWTDGKPISEETTAEGDSLVTLLRSQLSGDTNTPVNQNHKNTIAASGSIDAILDILTLPHTSSDITAGTPTSVTPGLLFLIRSPASLQVIHNGATYDGQDGIVFIPNPENGTYDVRLTGTGTGSYTLLAAQFTDSTNTWKEYTGTISTGAQKTYTVTIDNSVLFIDASVGTTTTQKIDEIDQRLVALGSHNNLASSRRYLSLARAAINISRYALAKTYLETILTQLSLYRKSQTNESNINTSLLISEKIIELYRQALAAQTALFPSAEVSRAASTASSYETSLTGLLSGAAGRGETITTKANRFTSAKEYRVLGEAHRTAGRMAQAKITLLLSQLLFREAL